MRSYAPRSVTFGRSPIRYWNWNMSVCSILKYLKDSPFITYHEPNDFVRKGETPDMYGRDHVAMFVDEQRRIILQDHARIHNYISVSRLQYDSDNAVWFDCDITDRGEEAFAAMQAGWWWDGYEHRIDEEETERCWRGRINAIRTADHPVFNDVKRITDPRLSWVSDAAFHKKLEVWTPT